MVKRKITIKAMAFTLAVLFMSGSALEASAAIATNTNIQQLSVLTYLTSAGYTVSIPRKQWVSENGTHVVYCNGLSSQDAPFGNQTLYMEESEIGDVEKRMLLAGFPNRPSQYGLDENQYYYATALALRRYHDGKGFDGFNPSGTNAANIKAEALRIYNAGFSSNDTKRINASISGNTSSKTKVGNEYRYGPFHLAVSNGSVSGSYRPEPLNAPSGTRIADANGNYKLSYGSSESFYIFVPTSAYVNAGSFTVTATIPKGSLKADLFVGLYKSNSGAIQDVAVVYQNQNITIPVDANPLSISWDAEPQTGTLQISKTSEDGVKSGFQFQVTGGGIGLYSTVTTDTSGVVTLSSLPAGTYQIKEINVPAKYFTPDNQTATITAGQTTYIGFHNEQRETSIVLQGFSRKKTYQQTGSLTYVNQLRRGESYYVYLEATNPKSRSQTVPYSVTVTNASPGSFSGNLTIPANSTVTIPLEITIPQYGSGNVHLEGKLNWDNRSIESNPNNNQAILTGAILTGDFYGEYLTPTAPYREETSVFATFKVTNTFAYDLIPEDDFVARIQPYYYNTANVRVNIPCESDPMTVIPKNGTNLIWAKFTSPKVSNTKDGKIYIELSIDPSNFVYEDNEGNNTVTASRSLLVKEAHSKTPDPVYESKPSSFSPSNPTTTIPGLLAANLPTGNTEAFAWERWKYSGGIFVKEQFGASLAYTPVITADPDIRSTKYTGGIYTMRSGYGFLFDGAIGIHSTGTTTLTNKEYSIATAKANMYFPEFNYRHTNGLYRTLDYAGNRFKLAKNPMAIDAVGLTGAERPGDQSRIHFTPLWTPDGAYVAKTVIYDVWTPGGMISRHDNVGGIEIDGDLYDDWYINEHWRSN